MNKEEKISICVPCYNSMKYLPETVNSILEQTHQNLELILIDDGSTDETPKYIKNLTDSNTKIKGVLLEKNTGNIGLVFNRGFQIATGQYYMDFGSDDILEKTAMQELLNIFRQDENLGLVYSGYTWFKDETYEIINQIPRAENKAYHYEKNKLLKYNYIAPPNMYKRKYYDMVGGFSQNYESAEDYDLYLKLEEVCEFKQLQGKFLCRYRHRVNSISNAKSATVEINAVRARSEAKLRRGL